VSSNAKKFLLEMLVKEPYKRPKAIELLNHTFITKCE